MTGAASITTTPIRVADLLGHGDPAPPDASRRRYRRRWFRSIARILEVSTVLIVADVATLTVAPNPGSA